MTSRERFVDYVKNGGDKVFASLQIGAGAGFDVKLAGKEWISEGTLQDTIDAYEKVGCDSLLNTGFSDLIDLVPGLKWETRSEDKGKERITYRHLDTPYGEMNWAMHERKYSGATPTQYPLTFGEGLDKVFWMVEQQSKVIDRVGELITPAIEQIHPHHAVSVQWPLQPFECLGLATVPDVVMSAMTDLDAYRRLCDQILELNIALCREVIKAGADFIFLGGPGREMMSPQLYEMFMVPDSQKITQAVHEAGGLIYTHICSPVEPFLSTGYYSQMGIDLFETLSPPPVGNVESLAEARKILPAEMCTRGNIGLDVLLKGSVADVRKATETVIEATRGTKHMVAASDYLFYDIPFENVKAVMATVNEANA